MRHVVGLAGLALGVWLALGGLPSRPGTAEMTILVIAYPCVLLGGALAWKRPKASVALFLGVTILLAVGPAAASTPQYFVLWSVIYAGVTAVLTLLAYVAVLNRERAQAAAARQTADQVELTRKMAELEQAKRAYLAAHEQLRQRNGIRAQDV